VLLLSKRLPHLPRPAPKHPGAIRAMHHGQTWFLRLAYVILSAFRLPVAHDSRLPVVSWDAILCQARNWRILPSWIQEQDSGREVF